MTSFLLNKVSTIGNIWQCSQELGKILKLLITSKRYWLSSANYYLGLLCLKQYLTHLSASSCDMFSCSSNSIKRPTHLSLWPKRMWEAFSISIEPFDGITTVLRLNNQQLMSHLKSIEKSWTTRIRGHNTVVLNDPFQRFMTWPGFNDQLFRRYLQTKGQQSQCNRSEKSMAQFSSQAQWKSCRGPTFPKTTIVLCKL